MGASIATRMASLAPDRNVHFYGFLDCRHVYDSSASLLWIRRLLALPFCFDAFSSSRLIASRGERVGGCPARLRGAERDAMRATGARAVPPPPFETAARSGVTRTVRRSRGWWRIVPPS